MESLVLTSKTARLYADLPCLRCQLQDSSGGIQHRDYFCQPSFWAFHECDSFLAGWWHGIHGWGLSGAQRKVLHNLPLRTNLLHHSEVLSRMNDGTNTPSRSPCPVGKISRTLFNTGLDCFECASLIQSRLDPVPNLVPPFESATITYQRSEE